MCIPERQIDLHAHTCCSDGTLKPEELVALAASKELAAVAITDHDTLAGVREAMTAGERLGLRVVPGIEMSTELDDCDIHLVGLFVDPDNEELKEALEELRKERVLRNQRCLDNLVRAGFDIRPEDLPGGDTGKVLTRGNIGEVLVKKGYAGNVKEAMTRYMNKGCVGYSKWRMPGPAQCIRLLHQAGALVFVAHMNQIDRKDRDHSIAICREMIRMGADGLECRYCEFDDFWKNTADQIAEEFSCLKSGGSDFHGTLKQGLELGTGYGDLFVPESYLAAMDRRIRIGKDERLLWERVQKETKT